MVNQFTVIVRFIHNDYDTTLVRFKDNNIRVIPKSFKGKKLKLTQISFGRLSLPHNNETILSNGLLNAMRKILDAIPNVADNVISEKLPTGKGKIKTLIKDIKN